jgi:hypothetical protein
MKIGDPITALHYSVARVTQVLTPHKVPEYTHSVNPGVAKKGEPRVVKTETGKMLEKEVYLEECEVCLFQQSWSSTALGFDGIGGQAISSAYTVVVFGPYGDAVVYFNGKQAYHVRRPNKLFYEHVYNQSMHAVMGAARLYETPSISDETPNL